ncbi:Protein of unknown function [Cotesia congregata]|uniref:Uncharacterized protein n=1 Tax=Cotesia congregata TaxID=51543 RepID=A0A8J2HBH4_COTCN|nr:Protein of unknown function [Cotesia congregata]
MYMNKFIWWLMAVYSFDKISAFDNILYKRSPIPHSQIGQLLKLCYSERLNPVVITTNLIDLVDELRADDIIFPVMTIDLDFKAKDIQTFIPAYPLYIVSTDSTDQLLGLLNQLKSTPTWNISSIFIFIEFVENDYQNASQVLQLLWKFELLSSFYFCIDQDNNIMIYTYNPYTNRAPDSWTEVDMNDPNNRGTLYKRLYTPHDKEICKSLNYDKTKALDGYEVKAAGDTKSWENLTLNEAYDVSSFEKSLAYTDKMIMVSLFSALNATPKINYDHTGIYANNNVRGYLKLIVNGSHDIGVSSRNRARAIGVVDRVNLHYQNGFLILTQYRPFEIPAEEVTDFDDIRPAVALFAGVLVVTFITIALNTDYDYAQATLDIARMIVGAGIFTPLERLSTRICFVVSFLIIFFMNPAIQGQISSFLSTPNQRNVDNFNDVHDHKYDLYFPPFYKPYILDLNLWLNSSDKKFLHPIDDAYWGCLDYVLNDSSAACLTYSEFQVEAASKHNLHITKTYDLKFYLTFWVRKNWALKDRIDQIALRMTEAGLLDHWDKEVLYWPLKKINDYESIFTSTEYEQFELENMLLAYILLLLTTTLALIVFGFEILLNKIRPRRRLRLQQRIVIFNRRVHVINEWV